MKLSALSLLAIVFFCGELYLQHQRITSLESSLAASKEEAAKLQSELTAAQAVLNRNQGFAPAPTPRPDNSWMYNKRTSLDDPYRHR